MKGLQSWWKNRRPNEPTPVVMNVKGDPNAAYNQAGFGAAAQDAAREEARRRAAAEDDDVDTEDGPSPTRAENSREVADEAGEGGNRVRANRSWRIARVVSFVVYG